MYQYNVGPTLTPLSGAAEETACGLLLTDVSPNDSHHIPPDGKHPFGCDYGDRAAVEDTAREVRSLRRRGVRVAAVFMGEDLSVPGAEEIYEKTWSASAVWTSWPVRQAP